MTGTLANIIIIAIVLVAFVSAVYYIYKEKKKGRRCIGCPDGCNCAKAKAGMACKK